MHVVFKISNDMPLIISWECPINRFCVESRNWIAEYKIIRHNNTVQLIVSYEFSVSIFSLQSLYCFKVLYHFVFVTSIQYVKQNLIILS